jgi:hypothetical protein
MMGITKHSGIISLTLFFIIAMLIVQPVLADIPKTVPAITDTMSIAYRGNGGYYIGNTIILDGKDTAGNVTLLKITGPGLPAEGVPLYDLNGQAGSGNSIAVNPDGTWKFVWYTANINGIEKMQTTRYTLSATDLANPDNVAATSIFLKKADFSVIASPDTLQKGEYVELSGNAENGVSTVRIDVTDLSGNVLRTFESAVSASGYFNSGFHADMPPGQYYVVITNPVLKKSSRIILTIVGPQQTGSSVLTTPVPSLAIPVTAIPAATVSGIPVGSTGTLSITSVPSGATVSLDSNPAGVTPAVLSNLPVGTHQVEIKSPDYQTSSFTVTIKAGETVTISPVLQKNSSALPVYTLALIGGLLVVCLVIVLFVIRKKNP